jgi:ATP-dependent RNA helicase DDX21
VSSPKSKRAKKQEEPPQDDLISSKTRSAKKKKEPLEKKAVTPKTPKVPKSEEPSEEDISTPKPKKMKKEKEDNGEIGEKSLKLKNGFSHSEPDINSNEDASEESNSETEQVKLCFNRWNVFIIVSEKSVDNCCAYSFGGTGV